MAKRPAGLFLVLHLLGGCVTVGRHGDVKVPAMMEPLFVTCAPGDGASLVQAFEEDRLLGSAEVEWVAKGGGDWDVEVINAAGLTVLTAGRRGAAVSVGGPLAQRLPRISVLKNGFLEVDGHLIGLKASEVPCLLAFGLPRTWLSLVEEVETKGKKTTLRFSDPVRDMTVVAKDLGVREKESVCAEVAWTRLLVFGSSLTWCKTPRKATSPVAIPRNETTLTGVGDYALKWVRIE